MVLRATDKVFSHGCDANNTSAARGKMLILITTQVKMSHSNAKIELCNGKNYIKTLYTGLFLQMVLHVENIFLAKLQENKQDRC